MNNQIRDIAQKNNEIEHNYTLEDGSDFNENDVINKKRQNACDKEMNTNIQNIEKSIVESDKEEFYNHYGEKSKLN